MREAEKGIESRTDGKGREGKREEARESLG